MIGFSKLVLRQRRCCDSLQSTDQNPCRVKEDLESMGMTYLNVVEDWERYATKLDVSL